MISDKEVYNIKVSAGRLISLNVLLGRTQESVIYAIWCKT